MLLLHVECSISLHLSISFSNDHSTENAMQALTKTVTDAMKESRVTDILNLVRFSVLSVRNLFVNFCFPFTFVFFFFQWCHSCFSLNFGMICEG